VPTPRELLDIDGVVAAGEFNSDGSPVDFEAKMDMLEEMAQMMTQFCATVSMISNTLTLLDSWVKREEKARISLPISLRAQDISPYGSCKALGVRTSSLAGRGLWGLRTAACQCEYAFSKKIMLRRRTRSALPTGARWLSVHAVSKSPNCG
jgi:hypothetical protein